MLTVPRKIGQSRKKRIPLTFGYLRADSDECRCHGGAAEELAELTVGLIRRPDVPSNSGPEKPAENAERSVSGWMLRAACRRAELAERCVECEADGVGRCRG